MKGHVFINNGDMGFRLNIRWKILTNICREVILWTHRVWPVLFSRGTLTSKKKAKNWTLLQKLFCGHFHCCQCFCSLWQQRDEQAHNSGRRWSIKASQLQCSNPVNVLSSTTHHSWVCAKSAIEMCNRHTCWKKKQGSDVSLIARRNFCYVESTENGTKPGVKYST